jgi:hypothetical protein
MARFLKGVLMKVSVLAGCAALIATTAMAASDSAILVHKQAHRFVAKSAPGSQTLYDQNMDPSGIATLSQAADNFSIPEGHTWIIKEVDVTGVYFDGSGPADSENVSFYKDRHGQPGDLVVNCADQNGTGDGLGSFSIVLSKACNAKLKGGRTYWVSVTANMDFGNGEWGWELTSDTHATRSALWHPTRTCAAARAPGNCAEYVGELMFALKGKDKQKK